MAAIKVVKGKVVHNGEEYGVEGIVKGLSKKDSARLVNMGIGVSVDIQKDETPPYASDKPKKLTKDERAKLDEESRIGPQPKDKTPESGEETSTAQ